MCRLKAKATASLALALLSVVARADDAAKLDQFLTRLGLTDLRLAHMERVLDRENHSARRTEIARQLADAFAEELADAAEDSQRFAAVQARVERLLDKVPAARTPAVEVVLLQAEYQHAEALLLRWQEDPSDKAALEEAKSILSRIAPLLTQRQAEVLASAERAADNLDSIKNDSQRQAAEQQIQRQQAIAARAQFFAGWSAYYLGVTKQDVRRAKSDYQAAKEGFAKLLDVSDEKEYQPIDPSVLGLESIWRARAAIGLGLAELGLTHPAAAARIFGWLTHASAPPVIRDQAPYWYVQGMLNAGLWSEAAKKVTAEVNAFSGSPSPGKTSLCLAAVRSAVTLDASHKQERRELIEQGIRGLARMRQFEAIDKLCEKVNLEKTAEASNFHLSWLRGRREYLAAEKTKSADDFRRAAQTLTAALAQPQARTDLTEAGQARYYLGWARYRLEELAVAARLFHEAATVLRTAAPDVAVQAAWMHASCLVQLAAKDKRQITSAIAALQAFKQDFPTSEEAQRAGLIITRLRQSHASPEEAIRELAAIKSSEPTYASAQYEMAQLQYQLWSKANGNAAKAEPIAKELLKTVDRVLALGDNKTDAEQRLKAALLAIDVLQSAARPDDSRSAALLSSVAAAAEHLDPKNPAAVEFQYRRLQLAQKSSDETTLKSAAAAIAQHGTGSAYELPALVVTAKAAEQAVTTATAVDRPACLAEAARVHQRLLALLGDSTATFKENKNAFAAASKLAQYDEELGRWSEAADRLDRLLEAAPSDRRLLRRAGLANVQASRYREALPHWRALVSGLSSGSDDWLEAKYYQLLCLKKTDRAAAAKTYKQFKVLFPEVKSAAWRDKFAELEKAL